MDVDISEPFNIEDIDYRIIKPRSKQEFKMLSKRYNMVNDQFKETVIFVFTEINFESKEQLLQFPKIDLDSIPTSISYESKQVDL